MPQSPSARARTQTGNGLKAARKGEIGKRVCSRERSPVYRRLRSRWLWWPGE